MSLRRAVLDVQSCLIEAGYDTELGAGDIELANTRLESIQLSVFYQTLSGRKAYTVELMLMRPFMQRLQISILGELKLRVHFISLGEKVINDVSLKAAGVKA